MDFKITYTSRGKVHRFFLDWHVREGDVAFTGPNQSHCERGFEAGLVKTGKCLPRICWLKLGCGNRDLITILVLVNTLVKSSDANDETSVKLEMKGIVSSLSGTWRSHNPELVIMILEGRVQRDDDIILHQLSICHCEILDVNKKIFCNIECLDIYSDSA